MVQHLGGASDLTKRDADALVPTLSLSPLAWFPETSQLPQMHRIYTAYMSGSCCVRVTWEWRDDVWLFVQRNS